MKALQHLDPEFVAVVIANIIIIVQNRFQKKQHKKVKEEVKKIDKAVSEPNGGNSVVDRFNRLELMLSSQNKQVNALTGLFARHMLDSSIMVQELQEKGYLNVRDSHLEQDFESPENVG